jgi:hypothetical protein
VRRASGQQCGRGQYTGKQNVADLHGIISCHKKRIASPRVAFVKTE